MLTVAQTAAKEEKEEYARLAGNEQNLGVMRVTLKSAHLEVACILFHEMMEEGGWLGLYEGPEEARNRYGTEAIYLFQSDGMVRDVRGWGVSALGCALLWGFSVECF